jgi:hypothetical protein
MEAVTPLPTPNDKPRTRKNKGILNATAAIAFPPRRPMKIISTIVYKVWIPIPAIIGMARVHNALDGLFRKPSIREFFSFGRFIGAEFRGN